MKTDIVLDRLNLLLQQEPKAVIELLNHRVPLESQALRRSPFLVTAKEGVLHLGLLGVLNGCLDDRIGVRYEGGLPVAFVKV